MPKSLPKPQPCYLLASFLFLCTAAVSAQTLARPGWTGSGLTPQSWSKHAVLYEIDTRSFQDSNGDGIGDLKGIAQHLDYIKALGADAILLEPLAPAASGSGPQPPPVDPAIGTIDDFDELSQQASRRNLRILLDLPSADPGLARFWLTRGVAGFYIPGDPASPAMRAVRDLLPKYLGQRVLITDADLTANPASKQPVRPGKQHTDDPLLDSAMLRLPAAGSGAPAAQLRTALEQSQALLRVGTPLLVTDALGVARSQDRFAEAAHSLDAAKLVGTVLLLNRGVAIVYAGQELGLSSPTGAPVMMPWGPPPVAAPSETQDTPPPPPPPPAANTVSDVYVPYVPPPRPKKPVPPDPATAAGQDINPNSVLNFYRQLIQLHHGTGPVRDGEEIVLNFDNNPEAANALVWVRRPPNPSQQNPPTVIICNLSDKPLAVSLKDEMARLHLRGSFLRKVLRSDDSLGSMYIDNVKLPAFGVYVGDLRF